MRKRREEIRTGSFFVVMKLFVLRLRMSLIASADMMRTLFTDREIPYRGTSETNSALSVTTEGSVWVGVA